MFIIPKIKYFGLNHFKKSMNLTPFIRKTFSTCSTPNNEENKLPLEDAQLFWMSLGKKDKSKKAENIISEVVANLEAKPNFFNLVNEICKDLQTLFPGIKVQLFGSAGSKLALKNSDADISLYFKGVNTASKKFIFALKKKLKESNYFVFTIAILAKIPIIKCKHKNGILCDISFSNYLGNKDCDLTKFLLSIDDRIRPLILILKFLLQNEKLLFNTHCLVALIVFFLQVQEKPLIPPISDLQALATKREMCEGWNVSFTRNTKLLPKTNNEMSVFELLQSFFEFYSAFEFASEVISVFTGKSYLKPHFANEHLLPEEFKLYKDKVAKDNSFKFDCSKYLCIQGFFNHSANISNHCSYNQVKAFQEYCKIKADIGQRLLLKSDSCEQKVQFLVKLFEKSKPKQNSVEEMTLPDAVVAMQRVPLSDVQSSMDDFREKWWNDTFDKILLILRTLLNIEVHETWKEIDGESSNLVQERILSCKVQNLQLTTKLSSEVRKCIDSPEDMSLLEKQKIITDILEKTSMKKDEKQSYKFDIRCQFEKCPTRILMKFEIESKDEKTVTVPFHVCTFLSKHIPKWLM